MLNINKTGIVMENNDIFCFIMGIGAGFILASLSIKQNIPIKNSLKIDQQDKEDKEKKDPANWWKYGKDPFEYEEH